MPTPTKGPRLGGGPAHERLILANLATSLFEHDQITTTEAKAKRLRPLAERLITFAKRGDLHSRRRVMTVVARQGRRPPPLRRDRPRHGRCARAATPASPRSAPARATTPPWPSSSSSASRCRPRRRPSRRPRAPPSAPPRTPPSARPPRPTAEAAAVETKASPRTRPTGGRRPPRLLTAAELPDGAVAANEDGSAPEGYTVKGNADSGLVPRARRRSGTTRPSPSSGSRPPRTPRPPASRRPAPTVPEPQAPSREQVPLRPRDEPALSLLRWLDELLFRSTSGGRRR